MIEWTNGFAFAFIFYSHDDERFYDQLNGTTKNIDGKPKTYSAALTTLQLSEGLVFEIENIGIQMAYRFATFATTNPKLDANFGTQSLVFGLIYHQ